MCRAGVVAALIVVAVALGLGSGDLLAKTQAPFVVPTLDPRPDFVQLQAATWDWLRVTVTSSTFIAGTIVGVILAEVGRFLLRWTVRALGLAAGLARTVVHYRLLIAGGIAVSYYVVAHHVLA